jgi:hypothetical protein
VLSKSSDPSSSAWILEEKQDKLQVFLAPFAHANEERTAANKAEESLRLFRAEADTLLEPEL